MSAENRFNAGASVGANHVQAWHIPVGAAICFFLRAVGGYSQLSSIKRSTWLLRWRLHSHFEFDCYVAKRVEVSLNGRGAYDKRSVGVRTIDADQMYVIDWDHAWDVTSLYKVSLAL